MKPVNLLLHVQNMSVLPWNRMNACTKAECKSPHITTKPSEERTLASFVSFFFDSREYELAGGFYYTFTIPRISKEFDLLRFGKNFNINIELKTKASREKIRRQLCQNLYYLQLLEKPVYSFTFIEEENRLYFLENEEVKEYPREALKWMLAEQIPDPQFNIEEAFQPNRYLISPFENTSRFLKGQYFLTSHQLAIQKQILEGTGNTYCLMGGYGTGKTLLLYDLARKVQGSQNVCIVHGSRLNEAQKRLMEAGLTIISSQKLLTWLDHHDADLLILDEAQLYPAYHFNEMWRKVCSKGIRTIFSLDSSVLVQIPDSAVGATIQKILNLENLEVLRLTNRIRTSPQISSFILSLFNLRKRNPVMLYENVQTAFAATLDQAADLVAWLEQNGWTFINYPPVTGKTTLYDVFSPITSRHASSVVGMEFDKVCVVLDAGFRYEDGVLRESCEGLPYSRVQMLYQQVTRASQSLFVIVVENQPVFEKIIQILGSPYRS